MAYCDRMRPGTAVLLLALALVARPGAAERTLPDYRYFRALSIDLQGRPPTPAELAAFERPDFDLDAWIDTHTTGATYAERLRRIYMDLLRLEITPKFQFPPQASVLLRQKVIGPDGAPLYIYYRKGQRRLDPDTDGDFCLTRDVTGLQFPPLQPSSGFPRPVAQAVLDAKTVLVKPWWLYADYRAATPSDRAGPDWAKRYPGFQLAPTMLVDADGETPTTQVRVCREESQTAATGLVYVSGRPPAHKGEAFASGRLTVPPNDSYFAKTHKGRAVSCLTGTGFETSLECGCGVGLERCLPSGGPAFESPAYVMSKDVPLGADTPFDPAPSGQSAWHHLWWTEEATHFLDRIFLEDRDFREVLTSHATVVNGPLAQFYRDFAGGTCCGPGASFGYTEPEPLVEPGALPEALIPQDSATWMPVDDRGPHASGILTMPIFLTKYGSRRARAHVVSTAFLCKDFVAESVKLEPSTEPDLTKRPGCSACHARLEPMAAYFARVRESDWTYLPASQFPMTNPRCPKGFTKKAGCEGAYDAAFGLLAGAYASPSHAEAGPAGLAAEVVASPEFTPCVVQNVAASFLGRPLEPDDDAWKTQLVKAFVDGGYRMRPLVRAIVTSPRYRAANDTKPGS